MVIIHKIESSGIQTQDLTICLYLNLKHGELDHSATIGLITKLVYVKRKLLPPASFLCGETLVDTQSIMESSVTLESLRTM